MASSISPCKNFAQPMRDHASATRLMAEKADGVSRSYSPESKWSPISSRLWRASRMVWSGLRSSRKAPANTSESVDVEEGPVSALRVNDASPMATTIQKSFQCTTLLLQSTGNTIEPPRASAIVVHVGRRKQAMSEACTRLSARRLGHFECYRNFAPIDSRRAQSMLSFIAGSGGAGASALHLSNSHLLEIGWNCFAVAL